MSLAAPFVVMPCLLFLFLIYHFKDFDHCWQFLFLFLPNIEVYVPLVYLIGIWLVFHSMELSPLTQHELLHDVEFF